ncbi:MAG: hypothetical protein P8Z37_03550 [Acidobacteriota bacterium]|jgi:outer membrane protein assembly factor BamA
MHPLAMRLFTGFSLVLISCQMLVAQATSRTAEIEAAREVRSQSLESDRVSDTEAFLLYIKDQKILERVSAGLSGFRLKLGGLVTGSGFALGPEYLRRDLARGKITLRISAQSSFKKYQKYDLQVSLPSLAQDRLFFEFYAVHHRYPGLDYYGPGGDSLEENRTTYLLEDSAFDGVAGFRPFRYADVGFSGGYVFLNVGPGGDGSFPSTEKVFTAEQTPGIDRQTEFLRYGAFTRLDYLDNPGGPRSGGQYSMQFDHYVDRKLGLHDFNRLDFEIQQYIPFFNKRRVVALRLKSSLTFHESSQVIPFYFQPVLGGSDDLRGFRSFRFYGDNLLLANVEYRWETFSGLDSALFLDIGKVFSDHGQWNFKNMESSAGFGFRFNIRNSVFLRIDTGFSREGAQVWLKFSDIFAGKPLRFSSPY